ncbi:PilN domain-containing protein [Pelomonas sp. KK5]|uniref:PilN domain-containing protein n=1 Tax=Pelomonas sp. KK5 TaxID=1855730 RepID=UPI00097C8567|nr:PilN domain-containing protein [Pelomonas sp. KK5]
MSLAPSLSTERLQKLLPARRGIVRPALDFEQQRRGSGVAGTVLLLVGLLACGWVMVRFVAVSRELASPPIPAAAVRVAPPQALSKATAQRAEQAAAVVARLAMPWDDWFRQVEGAAKGKVVLTALQPEADGRRVRIAGEARRFEDLVEAMMRLEASPGFANVFLNEHAEAATGGISFVLSADWVGGP